jgi:hypothetical protein
MMNCKVAWRFAVVAVAGLFTLGAAAPAAADTLTQVAYFHVLGSARTDSLLIDWQGATRARVANLAGAQSGSVARDAAQAVLTLDSPLSGVEFGAEPDSCGEFPLLRRDTNQIVVRHVSGGLLRGTSQVVEIGTLTPTEGCDAGVPVPFGSLTDPGATMNRLAMVARPPMFDLLPGTRIAGFSEQEWHPDNIGAALAADVVTLHAGNQALFSASGRVVPAAFNADRWFVLNFGTFERAYTRLDTDLVSGAETWMRAEWSGGQVQRVATDTVVKLVGPVGFGGEAQASRVWESGLFSASQTPFFINLYAGGSGERILQDLDAGTETRQPITWAFSGANIVQTRPTGDFGSRERTWVPLRNRGANIRFVMESENQLFNDGFPPQVVIAPRVNFYIDRGAAVPPAP